MINLHYIVFWIRYLHNRYYICWILFFNVRLCIYTLTNKYNPINIYSKCRCWDEKQQCRKVTETLIQWHGNFISLGFLWSTNNCRIRRILWQIWLDRQIVSTEVRDKALRSLSILLERWLVNVLTHSVGNKHKCDRKSGNNTIQIIKGQNYLQDPTYLPSYLIIYFSLLLMNET